MAHQLLQRGPPYPTVRALAAWAVTHRHYISGRLLREGRVRADELMFDELLDVVETLMLDTITLGYDLDKAFKLFELEAENSFTPEEEWGETGAAEQAQDAMMERFPSAYRPEGLDDE